MKKLYLSILIFMTFFINNIYVEADNKAVWAEKITYGDGTTHPGATFNFYGTGISSNLTQGSISWIPSGTSYNSYGFNVKTVVVDSNLYTGAIVKAEFFILTNIPNIRTGTQKYFTTHNDNNDFVTITKIADNIRFIDNSGFGSVYSIVMSFRNNDCLDSEFGGRYWCYGDAYQRIFGFSETFGDNITYAIQLYAYGDVNFSDVQWGQAPVSGDDIGVNDKLSVWDTIKALPGNLLNWFTSLPSGIWNGIKTGFEWVTEAVGDVGSFILSLPSGIWNGIKTGFQWIVDGVTNLLNFFNNDDDVDVSGMSSIGLLPAGAVDSILNLPFTFLDNLNTNLTKQCVSTNLPLPYINKNLPLPCVNSIYSQIGGLSTFISSFSVILASFILFKYLINLYKWVDRTLSFRENNHLDNWGGL